VREESCRLCIVRGRDFVVSIFKKTVNFLTEVKAELGKVSWSTRQELMGSTIVVIVITAIMSLFIGMIDICLSKLLSILFK